MECGTPGGTLNKTIEKWKLNLFSNLLRTKRKMGLRFWVERLENGTFPCLILLMKYLKLNGY